MVIKTLSSRAGTARANACEVKTSVTSRRSARLKADDRTCEGNRVWWMKQEAPCESWVVHSFGVETLQEISELRSILQHSHIVEETVDPFGLPSEPVDDLCNPP